MARGKSSKPVPGQRVRVNDGVHMPEFDELVIGGWEGTILETSGSGSKTKLIVEWNQSAMEAMPEGYKSHCESQGLVANMVCLPAADVQPLE